MRQEKIQLGQDVADILLNSKFLYFVSYKGLKVKDMNAFRAKLAASGANCHVLKNRVVCKIAALNGMDKLANAGLAGDTAVVYGDDPGAAAKVLKEFAKDTNDVVAPKCGYFDGAMLSVDDIKAIAALPSREAILCQLLGLINTVPTQLVRVISARSVSVVNVVNAYKEKLEKAN